MLKKARKEETEDERGKREVEEIEHTSIGLVKEGKREDAGVK